MRDHLMKFRTELSLLAESEDQLANRIRTRLGPRGEAVAALSRDLATVARRTAIELDEQQQQAALGT